MSDEVVLLAKAGPIATITLNRPEKANTLRPEVTAGLDRALADANQDDGIKVIVLQGAGDNFCGGFDFSSGLDHYAAIAEEGYDPGRDLHFVVNGKREIDRVLPITVRRAGWRARSKSGHQAVLVPERTPVLVTLRWSVSVRAAEGERARRCPCSCRLR